MSNSGGLSSAELNSDEAEEARNNGAARPKLVPIPILSHALGNSSGLLILNTDETVSYRFLGKLYICFKQAGDFAPAGATRAVCPGPETFLIRPSLYSS